MTAAMAAKAAAVLGKKDKPILKILIGILLCLLLVITAVASNFTANNLQHYAQETVATEFAPLVDSVNAQMTDGAPINSELLYASYIELFDNNRHTDADKAIIRQRLICCFYTTETVTVKETDSKGHTSYHTETKVIPITDIDQIFNGIEAKFSIKIEKQERTYITQLTAVLTNYGSYSLNGDVTALAASVSKYCTQYGIPQYVSLVMAVIQQESGGHGSDPMQCSECSFNTRFPHKPNSITDPDYSIQCGVQNLASCLRAAKCKSQNDMQGISLALQGYNFGNGYIAWALQRGGYSPSNAVEFSVMESEKLGWSGYGDVNYVSHVLRYYRAGDSGSGSFTYPIQSGSYTISSGYGLRHDPMAAGGEFHKGIDLSASAGTVIHAASSGTVVYAKFGVPPYGGYGNLVIIQHSASLISMYAHCSALLVSVGQSVQKGQAIAKVGSTGRSTGNHCHFEIRLNGKSVDPAGYLK